MDKFGSLPWLLETNYKYFLNLKLQWETWMVGLDLHASYTFPALNYKIFVNLEVEQK